MVNIPQPSRLVFQQPGDGQCFRCCIATLLGCNLADVPPQPPPDEKDESPYWNVLKAWLEARGWTYLRVQPIQCGDKYVTPGWEKNWELMKGNGVTGIDSTPWPLPTAPYIAGGPSPRLDPAGHAVLMFRHQLLHDPYPGGTGIERVEEYFFFMPIAPWSAIL